MRDTLIHRGPDDSGEFIRPLDDRGPFVYFGHRRLSIIDLAGGHQPLSNEDGSIWVIFNGEIYNFLELKKRLEALGHRFKTHSDTEVIAHAYEVYGEECFKELDGMFAIAIWDDRRHRLVLARDRLGKKPLYYCLMQDTFIFASELKALVVHPMFPRRINPLSFVKYLLFEFIPSPHTIFQDASKLSPATYLCWDQGKCETNEYWALFDGTESREHFSVVDATERLKELLRKAVQKRLMSDVPLGIFLSGGIDSSTITALAQIETSHAVKTFSISFEDPSFDESKFSSLVSKHLRTEHYDQRMTAEDLLDLVPILPDLLDEPMADASILPTYLLSRFTRHYVTVALGGDGGDELFAGYPTYLAHRWADRYERLLGPFHPIIRTIGDLLPVSDDNISFDFKVKKFLSGIGFPPVIRNSIWLGSFSFNELLKVLAPPFANRFAFEELIEDLETYRQKLLVQDPTTLIQCMDLRFYLQDDILVKVDRASMASSLEVRAPFLDHELVKFAMRLPSSFKLRKFSHKYILKKAVSQLLPAEVIHRKKKGFGIPVAKWVKGPLKSLFQDLLNPDRIKREGFLNADYAVTLLKEHLAGKRDNRKQLWTLFIWELWHDRYLPSM